MVQVHYLDNSNLDPESLFITDYRRSEAFINRDLNPALYYIVDLMIPPVHPREQEYLYHISNVEVTYKNAEIYEILQYDQALFTYEKGQWTHGGNIFNRYINEDYSVFLSFPHKYMAERQKEWQNERLDLLPCVITLILSAVVSLLSIIYLMCVTGRRAGDDEVHLSAYVDRIYSDILITAGIFGIMLWVDEVSRLFRSYYPDSNIFTLDQTMSMAMVGLVTAFAATSCGIILLSLVRKLKGRKLIKNSLIYTVLANINDSIRNLFILKRFEHFPLTKLLNMRQIVFIAASAGMVFLTLVFLYMESMLIIIPPAIEIVIIYMYFRENNKTFDEINKGFNESLEEQMKSERMKVDLITNVSHDIKTPLTSIISYVDLLSKEELSDTCRDYVNILADKSCRLKNIVSDLFDLAKSTSGNLPLDLESIDLRKLIEQTLADMEDEIAKSDLQVRTKLTESPIYIYSDGKKLYRVFQNILGNALKYSLSGTRVYIDMEPKGDMVTVTLKNTASYEMNFTAEDILQRFNRGDKSRSTEGSGLGVSIAESFTGACGGSFKLDIDGDQFKVKLEFVINKESKV